MTKGFCLFPTCRHYINIRFLGPQNFVMESGLENFAALKNSTGKSLAKFLKEMEMAGAKIMSKIWTIFLIKNNERKWLGLIFSEKSDYKLLLLAKLLPPAKGMTKA